MAHEQWGGRVGPMAWVLVASLLVACGKGGLPQVDGASAGGDAHADARADLRVRPPADHGQPFGWAVSAGGASATIEFARVAVDGADNIYVAGTLRDVASFGALTVGRTGESTGFVAKLDPGGSFLWVTTVKDASSVTGLAVDAAGNSAITGGFAGSVEIGGITLSGTWSSIFVARLDPLGKALWAVPVTSDGPPPAPCCCGVCGWSGVSAGPVALDGGGNLYLGGTFGGPATFGVTKIDATALFVAKLGPAGELDWVKTAPSEGAPGAFGYMQSGVAGLAVGAGGQIYLTGNLSGKVTFGGATLDGKGVFVTRLSESGELLWASRVFSDAVVHDIVVDGAGNGYLAVQSGQTVVIAKHDASGKLDWSKTSFGSDYRTTISLDRAGNICLAGEYSGAQSVGAVSLPVPNDRAVFVARASPAGELVAAAASGSSARGGRLAVDGQGSSIVVGTFGWPTLFGGTALSPRGPLDGAAHDLFIWKLRFP
jgi:hypothetical protein